MGIKMTEIIGFIGFIITLLIIIPASVSALIRVFSHPIREITDLWLGLIDQIVDIIDTIKKEFTIRK
jgi:hypothetical protein